MRGQSFRRRKFRLATPMEQHDEEIDHEKMRYNFRSGDFSSARWERRRWHRRATPTSTRTEITNFDHYLDNHPEVRTAVRGESTAGERSPIPFESPRIQGYLSDHPGVRQDMQQNPRAFMIDEGRTMGAWAVRGGLRHRGGPKSRVSTTATSTSIPKWPNKSATTRDWSTIRSILATHPGLDEYFKNHPEVRQELQQHPDRFMAREHYYENHGEGNGAHPLATTDRYIDGHPEVSQELNRDPALVDNRKYVDESSGLA